APVIVHTQRTSDLAGVEHETEHVQVLLDNAGTGIQHQNTNVAILNGLQGFDNGKLLGRFNNVFTPAHPGGVDQCVILAVALVGDINTVTGGTGFVVYHHPVFTEKAVHQGGFTHVRAANHGNFNALNVQLFVRWR